MRSVKMEGKTNVLRHLKQFDDLNLQILTSTDQNHRGIMFVWLFGV